jgi:hypothetical protein
LDNGLHFLDNHSGDYDAGAWAQAGERLGDQRKATREVIAGTAIEPHLPTALAGDDAEAIVLDLDQI